MRLFFTSLLCLIFCFGSNFTKSNLQLKSQVITFERTDVEGKRADFVTATFTFGIDIRLDSIDNCSNVAFELVHNKTNYIKYSEMKISEDWGAGSVCHVVEPKVDTVLDVARIVVEAGTGRPADLNSPNSPKIIHLEFVVRPNAVHGEVVDFYLQKVRATVFRDTIIELLIPITPKFSYNVHSYITVWPGDSNNDGIVDDIDFALISKYLEEPKMKMRAFKRNPTSTLWKPQQVIALDTLAATYCDADGNGMITNSDHLVVVYNMDSVWNAGHKTNKYELQSDINILSQKNFISLPININNISTSDIPGGSTGDELIAAAGTFNLSSMGALGADISKKYKLCGMQSSGYFGADEKIYYYINQDSSWINFVINRTHNKNQLLNNNIKNNNTNLPIVYLLLEPITNNNNNNININNNINTASLGEILVQDFVGITENNLIINLEQKQTNSYISQQEDEMFSNKYTINYSNGNLDIVSSGEIINSVEIINYLGQSVVYYSSIGDYNALFRINNLKMGVYFIIINSKFSKNIFVNS